MKTGKREEKMLVMQIQVDSEIVSASSVEVLKKRLETIARNDIRFPI